MNLTIAPADLSTEAQGTQSQQQQSLQRAKRTNHLPFASFRQVVAEDPAITPAYDSRFSNSVFISTSITAARSIQTWVISLQWLFPTIQQIFPLEREDKTTTWNHASVSSFQQQEPASWCRRGPSGKVWFNHPIQYESVIIFSLDAFPDRFSFSHRICCIIAPWRHLQQATKCCFETNTIRRSQWYAFQLTSL